MKSLHEAHAKSNFYFSSSTKKCKRICFLLFFLTLEIEWFVPANCSLQNFTICNNFAFYIYLNIYWKMSALLFSEIACTGTYKKVCVRFGVNWPFWHLLAGVIYDTLKLFVTLCAVLQRWTFLGFFLPSETRELILAQCSSRT